MFSMRSVRCSTRSRDDIVDPGLIWRRPDRRFAHCVAMTLTSAGCPMGEHSRRREFALLNLAGVH